jgi:hypothetical protein
MFGAAAETEPQAVADPAVSNVRAEVHMLTPKVIEITRGSAHAEKTGPVKSGTRRLR